MDDNKIIKTYWEGPLSNMEMLSLESFIRNGHIVFVYTYDTKRIKPISQDMLVMNAADIIPWEKRVLVKGASTIFSDIFRYTLLLKEGGWWMDLDIVLLKPITTEQPIVASLCFSEDKNNQTLNNAPLKVPKGHDLAKACVQETELYNLGNLQHAQLAGDLLQKQITKLNLDEFVVSAEIYSPIGWKDSQKTVEPKFGFDLITDKTVAIHLFGYMWSYNKKLDKNAEFHCDSLYEWLKRKYCVANTKN